MMKRLLNVILTAVVCLLASTSVAQLTADFTIDKSSGCAPQRIVFTDASTGNPDTWLWDLGNGVTSTAQNPSTTYFTPGTYSVRLTVSRGGQSNTITKTGIIRIFAIPSVVFSANPLSGCIPLRVQFTDNSSTATGTITSWKWDFGDGNIGTTRNPLHPYLTSGLFNVTLTVENSDGCSNNASRVNYIRVNDSIRAVFGFRLPRDCSLPYTVQFTDSSKGSNITGWQWDFGDGGTSTSRNPSYTYTRSGQFTIRLIVTNSSGCADTMIQPNAIFAGGLAANFTISKSPACLNETVTFTNTTVPAGVDSIRWRFPSGTATGNTATARFNQVGVNRITMLAYAGGCVDSISRNITVLDGPQGDFDADVKTACAPPLQVNFRNLTTNGTVVRWNFSNGQTSTQENPSITFNNLANYTITLIVANPNGCRDTIVKPSFIRIQPLQITRVSGLPFQGCAPYTNTYTVSTNSSEPITDYSWDFGDGTTSTQANPTKTFADTGVFKVRLIVRTANGCIDTFENEVKTGLRARAQFTADPLIACPAQEIKFTNTSTGVIDKFEWDFGDGGRSSSRNPIYMYNDTGFMTVRLVVLHNGCGDTLEREQYIYIKPPIARFTDSLSCADPSTFYFRDESILASTWIWTFGDGTSFTGQSPPPKTYADTGTYTIELTVRDSICEHKTSRPIKVLASKAAINFQQQLACTSATYIFDGSNGTPSNNAVQYRWYINRRLESASDSAKFIRVFPTRGSVLVGLAVTFANGCVDSLTQIITIDFLKPTAVISPSFSATCAGGIVSFGDSSRANAGSPIVKWRWNFGTGSDKTFTAPPFSEVYALPGFYDLKLVVENDLGCLDSVVLRRAVGVYKPEAAFQTVDTLICVNALVRLANNSKGSQLSYSWNFGNGTSSTLAVPDLRYASPGKYTVRLAVSDTLGCKDTLLRPDYITVANAKADFAISDSFTSCPPLQVSFTNKANFAQGFVWDFGNGNGSTLLDPTHTYTIPGTFNAKLKVFGNGGCVDSATKTIKLQGPFGDIRYNPILGCVPLQVSFASTAVNTRLYTWDFADGSSSFSTDSTVVTTYRQAGKYLPKLILEDGLGCRLPILGRDTIVVHDVKAYARELPDYTFCDSASVIVFDSSQATEPIVSYRWNLGDGTISSLKDPQHRYLRPGRYDVSLGVTTASGCTSSDTLSTEVIIAETPAIDPGPDTAICVTSTLTFNGTWLNPDTSTLVFRWDFGNGIISNQLDPPPVTYNRPGDYQVGLSAVNRYGCIASEIMLVKVNDTPRIRAIPNTIICQGNSIALQGTGASTYRWDPSPTLSCTNCTSPLAVPAQPTIYRVTGTDLNGCVSSDTVLVDVKMPFVMQNGPGDTLCAGESVVLTANGAEVYRWSPAAGLSTTTGPRTTARPAQTTTYQVIGSDVLNCFSDTALIDVVVYPIPQFNIVESLISAPVGDVITLRATSSADITRWRWSPALGLSCVTCAEPQATVRQRITYTANVSNDGGCTASDQITIVALCSAENIFIPNTFSPNGDGRNDIFYPRGKGLASIKSMRIFNRWGEVMYERLDFAANDPSAGWNGTYRGAMLTSDVYVYTMEVLCDNNEIFSLKGNVTLLK